MIMLRGWMSAAQTVATTHSEGVWGPENLRAGCPPREVKSCHTVTVIFIPSRSEDADMHASTSLQLVTVSIDTSVAETQSHVGLTWNKVYSVANQ